MNPMPILPAEWVFLFKGKIGFCLQGRAGSNFNGPEHNCHSPDWFERGLFGQKSSGFAQEEKQGGLFRMW